MKVLVVDQDPRSIRLMQMLLKDQYVVDTAHTAREAEDLAYNAHHDIIIMQADLADNRGDDLCITFKSKLPNIPVIIVSDSSSVKEKVIAFKKGADDFLTKPISGTELRLRIKTVLRWASAERYIEEEIIRLRSLEFNRSSKTMKLRGQTVPLRKKEMELLEYMMINRGKVLSRMELLDHVWNGEVSPFTNTVDVHMKRIRDKIETPYNESYLNTIHGVGYILE